MGWPVMFSLSLVVFGSSEIGSVLDNWLPRYGSPTVTSVMDERLFPLSTREVIDVVVACSAGVVVSGVGATPSSCLLLYMFRFSATRLVIDGMPIGIGLVVRGRMGDADKEFATKDSGT